MEQEECSRSFIEERYVEGMGKGVVDSDKMEKSISIPRHQSLFSFPTRRGRANGKETSRPGRSRADRGIVSKV